MRKKLGLLLILLAIGQGCSDEPVCIQHVGTNPDGSPYSYYTGDCFDQDVIVTSQPIMIQFDNSFLEGKR